VSARLRGAIVLVAASGLAVFLVWGLRGLPSFGHYRGPYGTILNKVAVPERHATDVVTAVVFDYRGFDTLGEEFILFASVMAVALLLREARRSVDAEQRPPKTEAVRVLGAGLIGPTVLVGLYVVAHGYVSPGGGFQGGAILAGALGLLFLAGEYRAFRAASPTKLVDLAESTGAGGYATIGIAALLFGSAYLENIIGRGSPGSLHSAGTIALLNLATGLEVAAAFVLLFTEFLEELAERRA
jgi:multicomponent Na+:H+ antiporter subunit B